MTFTSLIRDRARDDDWAFAFYMTDGGLDFPAHLREASKFASAHDKGLVLISRGHAKTTLFLYRTARLIGLHEGRRRIGILTAVTDDAIARSVAIRNIVEHPRFAEVFPWARKGVAGSPWKEDVWNVRGVHMGKDHTMTAIGLQSARAGARLDDLLADDMVGKQENATANQRAKAAETYWAVVDPMIVPDGTRFFLGTRWHEDDIYAELIRKGWPHLMRRAIQDDGTALWPGVWDIERLRARREDLGSAIFDLQYQNDPTGMGGNIFKREWFRYVERLPERVSRRAGVDLASSISQRADYTALGEVCEDDEHNLYVVGSYADRLDEGHRVWLTGLRDGAQATIGSESPRLLWGGDQLPEGFAGFHGSGPRPLTGLNIESVTFQSTFAREVLASTRLPARQVHPDKDKVTRARTLAARYEAGKVFHLRSAAGIDAYEREAVAFPNGEHDDRVDAMVYAADLGGSDFYFTSARR